VQKSVKCLIVRAEQIVMWRFCTTENGMTDAQGMESGINIYPCYKAKYFDTAEEKYLGFRCCSSLRAFNIG
jgi:hypothetical protein